MSAPRSYMEFRIETAEENFTRARDQRDRAGEALVRADNMVEHRKLELSLLREQQTQFLRDTLISI